jgi:hypothetical protein
MNGAHSDPIWNDGLAASSLGSDVSCVEKGKLTEATERAPLLIRHQDALAEYRLVEPDVDDALGQAAYGGVRVILQAWAPRPKVLVQCHDKLLLGRLLGHDPDWIAGLIDSSGHSYEPYELVPRLLREPEGDVVIVVRIIASPFVAGEIVRAELIVVGSALGVRGVRGEDAYGPGESANGADTSLRDERDSAPLEGERLEVPPGDEPG